MDTHFVLVHPSQPGNIGSCARALKTMGFKHLHIVGDAKYLDELSLKMAYGSHDVLKSIQVHSSLEQVLSKMDFSIGTTAKKRTIHYDYFSPEEAKSIVDSKQIKNLAIVFGREDRGLEASEIDSCDLLSHIPLVNPYPSLNLGQSVMLYAYAFRKEIKQRNQESAAGPSEQKVLKDHAEKLLDQLKIAEKPQLKRRIMERLMQINQDDTHLFLSFHRYLTQKLKKVQ
jgi:tRNA/rRNA methyltransferase